jgi:hypothetical protein
MKRNVFGLAILLAIPLCMGQSCSSSFLNAVGDSITDQLDGDNDTEDGTDTDTTTDVGVPEGVYSGSETIVQTIDNVNDAYPADSSTSTVMSSFAFDSDGLLLGGDNSPILINDSSTSTTDFGQLTEVVIDINQASNVTQYVTQATMTISGSGGLSWSLTGTGLHTFRLTGGKVVYVGSIDMESDTVGGAAYSVTIDYNASLTE